jgi:Bacterial Ig-like domain (group 2)
MPVPVRTAIALCVAALGCGSGGSTGPAPVATVSVSLSEPSVLIGDHVSATATARDASGNILPGRAVSWSSTNSGIAWVDAAGVVTAVAPGTAVITATSEGRSGTANLTVNLPGFGSSSEKIKIVDIGGVFTPTLLGPSRATTTFVSRATTVATVNAQGTITGVGEGQVWVVATAPGWASDSVYVIVPRTATGPVLRTDLTTFNVAMGSTIVFDVILDTRSTPIGGTEFSFGITTTPVLFTDGTYSLIGSPTPVVSNPQLGVLRVSLASGGRLTGELAILRLELTVRTANTSGFLTLTLIDLVSPTGADLMPVSTSTRIPIIVQ